MTTSMSDASFAFIGKPTTRIHRVLARIRFMLKRDPL
jgi:hypothetical protein